MNQRVSGLCFLIFLFLSTGRAMAQSTPNPALLIGEKSGALLAIVDPNTLEIIEHVPANRSPHEVATDGRYGYISNSGAGAITVIDLEARRQIEGIDLGPMGPVHSLVMADGKLWFAHEGTRTISRYDPETGQIDWVLGTGTPRTHMITMPEDASQIFAVSFTDEILNLLEENDNGNWESTIIPTGPRSEGLDLSPDGSELWVNNVSDSTISIIDVRSKKEAAKLKLPTVFSNRLKFTPDGRYVFVSELRGNEILVIDAETHQWVKWIDVGGGSEGLLMSPDGTRAFVAVSAADKVAVINLETLTVVGEIPGLNNPDGMAWAVRP